MASTKTIMVRCGTERAGGREREPRPVGVQTPRGSVRPREPGGPGLTPAVQFRGLGVGTMLAPLEGMEIRCSALSHVGRRRNNEDAYAVHPELGLSVVADGMGGYEGGEVASRIVVDSLVELFARHAADRDATWPHAPRPPRGTLHDLVGVGLRHAHESVLARREGPLARMGSTAVVAAWSGSQLVVGHVGDSRLYRLREGVLERLTQDHSVVEEARRAGVAGDDIDVTGFRHMLTRAVGMPGDLGADISLGRLQPGDVLLLCSDGVWEPQSEARIIEALQRPRPEEAVRALVARAYDEGGTDNMTALVMVIGA